MNLPMLDGPHWRWDGRDWEIVWVAFNGTNWVWQSSDMEYAEKCEPGHWERISEPLTPVEKTT